MKNGEITGKLRWQPDKFRAETTHQLYLLCLHVVTPHLEYKSGKDSYEK
jgi:hypothetical protein